MFEILITLFSEADWLFFALYSLSIMLSIIEIFLPSFGIAGISGVLMLLSAITERCVYGNNSSKEIVFYIIYCILFFAVIVTAVKLIVVKIAKKIRNKTKFAVVDGNKIPLNSDGSLNYSFLLGKEGETITDLKPIGKVKFNEGIFEATTTKEYLYSGTIVKVDKIINQKIVVKKKD